MGGGHRHLEKYKNYKKKVEKLKCQKNYKRMTKIPRKKITKSIKFAKKIIRESTKITKKSQENSKTTKKNYKIKEKSKNKTCIYIYP